MRQLIFLIIIMLVISSFSTVAKTTLDNKISEKIESLNINDDTPIWEIGDYWTYDISAFKIELNQTEQIINLDLTWDSLKLEVKTITTDTYTVDITGKIQGSFSYDIGTGKRLSGNLYFNRFSGNMQVRKSDLAFKKCILKLKSIALLKEHPLSIPISLPIPLTFTLNLENSVPRPLIDFPLFDGKMGLITESSISANITVESIILKILNIITPDIPPGIYFDYSMSIPELFYNATIDNITVKAGTFSAYNIVFYEGFIGSLFYAPTVGNVIKAQTEFSDSDMLNFKFHGELKEYSYS